MIYMLDHLLERSYWDLRLLSVLETPEDIFKDAYMLQSNLETFYTYEAAGFFRCSMDEMDFIRKYIKPLTHVHDYVKSLNSKKYKAKSIRDFLYLYGAYIPSETTIESIHNKMGIFRKPKNLDYRASLKWIDYPRSIKSITKTMYQQDLIFRYL